MPESPLKRSLNNPWPYWANILRTSSSHEEGCIRKWSIVTTKMIGNNSKVEQIEVKKVEWIKKDRKMQMKEIEGSTEYINADIVLLAMGFLHPVHKGLADNQALT